MSTSTKRVKRSNITLREFDIHSVADNSSCLFIGGRNTGKTTAIYNLLSAKQKSFDTAMIICPTSKVNDSFKDIVPAKFIHDNYDTKVVNELIKRQERILTKKRSSPARYGKSITTTCLLLDDMAFDKSWMKDTNLRLMAMNGRHYDALLIVSLQYCLTMGPDLRANFQWVFLHRTNNHREKERLHDYFAGMFKYFDEFNELFDEITEDYGVMVIDMNSKSNKIDEIVFWFKPKPREDLNFTICASRHWEVGLNTESIQPDSGVRTFNLMGGGK